jgi:hypothetical protein
MILAGVGAHFALVEGGASHKGIVMLLRHLRSGLSSLLTVTEAAANFASHTSIAGAISLLAEGTSMFGGWVLQITKLTVSSCGIFHRWAVL